MKSSRLIALTMTYAFVACLALGCGISKKPKNHWWQFWRSKTSQVAGLDGSTSFNEPPTPFDPNGGFGTSAIGGMSPGGIGYADPIRTSFNSIEDLQTVYFDLDQDAITQEAASVLEQNASWIAGNPQFHVQIEGHCDERGTIEYNLNLGQRRADIVREYLVMSGIPADRLHPISYGEERPVGMSTDETSLAENRRVQFLVYDPNG